VAQRRLAAVVTLCRQLQGTGHRSVPIVRILELADPEGQEKADPRADPVTGCLPVTPEPGAGAGRPADPEDVF